MHFRRVIEFVLCASCLMMICSSALGNPAISNVTAASDSVGKYDIFTLDFNVATVASNYYRPTIPPASVHNSGGSHS